jgi:hypothetical protein
MLRPLALKFKTSARGQMTAELAAQAGDSQLAAASGFLKNVSSILTP